MMDTFDIFEILRKKSNRKSTVSVELDKFKAKIPMSKERKKQLVKLMNILGQFSQNMFHRSFL